MAYNGYIHKFCTYLLFRVFSYRKKVVLDNLRSSRLRPDGISITDIVLRYYQNLSAYFLETVQLFSRDQKWLSERIEYTGVEEIESCLKEKSVIVIGSHLGNWEWAAVLFPLKTHLPAYAVYKPLSNKALDVPIKASRSRFGLGLLNMKEVVRFFANNAEPAVFFFVSDQSPSDIQSGSWHSFLGRETLFHNGPELLSKKYQLPVFTQSIIRTHGSRYRVSFQRVTSREITAAYVAGLEQDIYQQPEAWLWSHRRWKHKKSSDAKS